MSFVNKELEFNEFIRRLHQRIQRGGNVAALIFFECFLQEELPRELKRQAAVPDWDGRTVNAGDFDAIYPMAANILHDAASRSHSECHPDIFTEASVVSSAFRDELNELFQCSGNDVFDLIPIKSYTEMAVEAGLVKLTLGPDGQMMVSLSKEGERVAREVEQEIKEAGK
ncbi:MAG: hypothetical protein AAB509_02045 [Patescibacteria group bacterium]